MRQRALQPQAVLSFSRKSSNNASHQNVPSRLDRENLEQYCQDSGRDVANGDEKAVVGARLPKIDAPPQRGNVVPI
jgi:hypothetical protein